MSRPPTSEDRFWSHVDKNGPVPAARPDLGPCWLWTARVDRWGYGKTHGGRVAHKFAYQYVIGLIPDGLTLDHLCTVRHCVNPAHLEPVTMKENLMRGNGFGAKNARKTHCHRGHEFTPENTLTINGRRVCRPCNRLRLRERYAKRGY